MELYRKYNLEESRRRRKEQNKEKEWIRKNVKLICTQKSKDRQTFELPWTKCTNCGKTSHKDSPDFECNAFGEIEFTKKDANTKYVRVYTARNMDHLLLNIWKVDRPQLLISVVGGSTTIQMDNEKKKFFCDNFKKLVDLTGAWIITSGKETEVLKCVGEAFKDSQHEKQVPIVGIIPWDSLPNNASLINKEGKWPYVNNKDFKENHTHLFLVDEVSYETNDGENPPGNSRSITTSKKGQGQAGVSNDRPGTSNEPQQKKAEESRQNSSGGATNPQDTKKHHTVTTFRNELEAILINHIEKYDVGHKPAVILVMGGELDVLKSLHNAVDQNNPKPVVIIQGFGGVVDILASVVGDCQRGSTVDEQSVAEQVEKQYKKEKEHVKSESVSLILAISEHYANIKVFESKEEIHDKFSLAEAIYNCIAEDIGKKANLKKALIWNTVDNYTELPNLQLDDLDRDMVLTALRHQKADFVQLFIDKGLELDKVLIHKDLLTLYEDKYNTEPTAGALFAIGLYNIVETTKKLKKTETLQIKNSISDFEKLAMEMMNMAYARKKSFDILVQKLEKWNNTSCLSLASNTKNIGFMSHTAFQKVMDYFWWGKFQLSSVPHVILYSTFGIKTVVCDTELRESVAEFYNSPAVIFGLHVLPYWIFLGLYSYLMLVKFNPYFTIVEGVVCFWVFTIACEEIRQIHNRETDTVRLKVKTYWSDWWNKLDVFTIVLFIIGIILRVIPDDDTFEAARVCLCVNLAFFYLRILNIFIVSESLGPKIQMIGKMVREDLMPFMAIIMVFISAYSIASEAILYPNTELSWKLLYHFPRKAYWQVYGELFLEDIEGSSDCTDDPALYNNYTMLRCPSEVGKYMVPIMLGFFMLAMVVLLLNLLIAMFSHTFQQIQMKTYDYWCYQRYQLIREYYFRPVLPPPLILLVHVFKLFRYCFKVRTESKQDVHPESSESPTENVHEKKPKKDSFENLIAKECLKKLQEDPRSMGRDDFRKPAMYSRTEVRDVLTMWVSKVTGLVDKNPVSNTDTAPIVTEELRRSDPHRNLDDIHGIRDIKIKLKENKEHMKTLIEKTHGMDSTLTVLKDRLERMEKIIEESKKKTHDVDSGITMLKILQDEVERITETKSATKIRGIRDIKNKLKENKEHMKTLIEKSEEKTHGMDSTLTVLKDRLEQMEKIIEESKKKTRDILKKNKEQMKTLIEKSEEKTHDMLTENRKLMEGIIEKKTRDILKKNKEQMKTLIEKSEEKTHDMLTENQKLMRIIVEKLTGKTHDMESMEKGIDANICHDILKENNEQMESIKTMLNDTLEQMKKIIEKRKKKTHDMESMEKGIDADICQDILKENKEQMESIKTMLNDTLEQMESIKTMLNDTLEQIKKMIEKPKKKTHDMESMEKGIYADICHDILKENKEQMESIKTMLNDTLEQMKKIIEKRKKKVLKVSSGRNGWRGFHENGSRCHCYCRTCLAVSVYAPSRLRKLQQGNKKAPKPGN